MIERLNWTDWAFTQYMSSTLLNAEESDFSNIYSTLQWAHKLMRQHWGVPVTCFVVGTREAQSYYLSLGRMSNGFPSDDTLLNLKETVENIDSCHSNKFTSTWSFRKQHLLLSLMCEVIWQMMILEMKAGTSCFSHEETCKKTIRSNLYFRKIFLAMLWRTGEQWDVRGSSYSLGKNWKAVEVKIHELDSCFWAWLSVQLKEASPPSPG